MKTICIYFAALAILLQSCHSSKFTSRKYMSGRYSSFAVKKKDVSNNESPNRNYNKINSNTQEATIAKVEVKHSEEITVSKPAEIKSERSDSPILLASIKNLTGLKNNKIKTLPEIKNISPILNKQNKSSEGGANNNSRGIIGVVFSSLGIVFDVVGLVVVISSLEYTFLIFTLLGLVFGALGLIFGISNMKKYKRDKANGNRNVTTLILGIIATVMGGVAMFMAAYFSLWGALLISVSEDFI